MKRKILLLTVSLIYALTMFSQDRDMEAQMHYTKAEEHFNNGYWVLALGELSDAEAALGATNSKILYLKARALSKSEYKQTFVRAPDLDTALKKFFSLTDAKTYPADKYMDIMLINSDFQEFKKDLGFAYDSIAARTLNKSSVGSVLLGLQFLKNDAIFAAISCFQIAAGRGNPDGLALEGLCYLMALEPVKGSNYLSGSPLQNDYNSTRLALREYIMDKMLFLAEKIYASANGLKTAYSYNKEMMEKYVKSWEKYYDDDTQRNKTVDFQKPYKNLSQFPKGRSLIEVFIINKSSLVSDRTLAALLSLAGSEQIVSNPSQSFTYYLQCAELGNAECMKTVSTMYKKGQGVKKDKAMAEEWEKKSLAISK